MHMPNRTREKVFGAAPRQQLDRNAKARLLSYARSYNATHKTERQHHGPITRAAFEVLRVLVYGFHHTDGDGCYPSYEAAAKAARCARSTFAEAIRVLELAALLTWVNRLHRVRVIETDLFGQRVLSWKVVRSSNGYSFLDPLDRDPGRRGWCCKSEKPTAPVAEDFSNQNQTPVLPLDLTTPLGRALDGWGRALGALPVS